MTVEEDARQLGRSPDQVSSCRRGVHRVLHGAFAANKTQAGYDEAILRALLHLRGEMSPELRRYVDARLSGLRTTFSLTTRVEPLRCPYGFDTSAKSIVPVTDVGQFEEPRLDVASGLAPEDAVIGEAAARGLGYGCEVTLSATTTGTQEWNSHSIRRHGQRLSGGPAWSVACSLTAGCAGVP